MGNNKSDFNQEIQCPICFHRHCEITKKSGFTNTYKCFGCANTFTKEYLGLDVRKGDLK